MSLVDELLPSMHRVLAADRDLHDLSLLWQMIEASTAISCPEQAETILPTLSQTRARFADLQQRLVRQLGREHLESLGDELASVAQCTIDILVRNLFERTADVGFLATDDVLRAFCAAPAAQRAAEAAAVHRRLHEYRAKYSVYDDVIVLAPDGTVLARLEGEAGPAVSADAIVAEAMRKPGYVERYDASDLAPGATVGLRYGHRIEDGDGHVLAVLVLRFRFSDELARIFASFGDARKHLAIVLVDSDNQVLLSSDPAHVPLAARMQSRPEGEVGVTVFGGREYLSVTCATRGYQGYGGPGWRVQAMVSLLTAFRASSGRADDEQPVTLDNEALGRIQANVDAINRNLRRVVWNGRLMAGARGGDQAQLKAVLHQVNGAGTRTRDRVAAAIGDLHRTARGRAQHQAHELARLAADIMDRNLYERANDCRWWALSPLLCRVLAAPADAAPAQSPQALQAMLAHINSLYTVYTRLVVFDAQGVIRAASNDDPESPLRGQCVDPALLRAVQALPDSQRYAVTDFAPTPLNNGVPTYVFLAAVRAPESTRVVGGIAIVFNAEREFRAMLGDVLGDRQGLAAFVDAQGRVLSCTDPAQVIGQRLRLDLRQTLVEYDGAHLALTTAVAGGYREFKQDDGYRNGVRAVVALRLGAVDRRRHAAADTVLRGLPPADRHAVDEWALFQVGGACYGLALAMVLEARDLNGLVRAPGASGATVGLLEVPGDAGALVVPVLCARRLLGVDHPPRASDGVVLVLPAAPGLRRPALGLRVDDVRTVAEIGREHVQAVPAELRQRDGLVSHIARMSQSQGQAGANQAVTDELLIQLLDDRILVAAAGLPASAGSGTPALAA